MEFKDLIQQVLIEKEGLPGLEVCEVKESVCTKPGDNYFSEVRSVQVLGVLPGGKPYSTNLFVKRLRDAVRSQDYLFDVAFGNEMLMYLRVLPKYSVTVPCTICYHASSDLIILQDLQPIGYRMWDRRTGFDLPTTTHVLKALARFHAASYHMRMTRNNEFTNDTDLLKPIGLVLSSIKDVAETSLRRAIKQVTGIPELGEILPFLLMLKGNVSETLKMLRKPEKIAVLCHGDFWINNILIRQGTEDSVRIVDFQTCAVLSPAVDVWSLLYTSVQHSVLENHIDNLLLFYSQSFLDDLIYLEIPLNNIQFTNDLLEDLKSRELYGFLLATVYLPSLELSEDTFSHLETITREQSLDEKFLDQFLNSGFKDRICNLVTFCHRRGLFNSIL